MCNKQEENIRLERQLFFTVASTERVKAFILTFLISLAVFCDVHAAHISGGEFSVVSLGNNLYTVTYNTYTICGRSGSGAGIVLYNNDTRMGMPLNGFVQVGPQVQLPNVSPCPANPNGSCTVQTTFSANVVINPNTNGYVIYRSANARSAGINNIQNSGQSGYAYFVQIPGALTIPNNSTPVFNNLPPASICTGVPIQLNVSATDPDGDVLVYSFANPLARIQPTGTGLNYVSVAYQGGASINNQTGNGLQLNATTGIISGVQTTTGIFSIAIQVQEFRNGVLIGTTMRDFIYNFQNCPTTNIPATNLNSGATVGINGTVTACAGTVNIDATQQNLALQNFIWSDGTIGPVLTVNPSTAGTYSFGATNSQGCLFSGQATVNYTPITCSIVGNSNMCLDNVSALIANCNDPNATILWDGGSTMGWQYTPSGSGQIICSATSSDGNCFASDTFTVVIDTPVVLNLGADTALCNTETLAISPGNLNVNWSWEDQSTTNPRILSASGQYIATATNGMCVTSDTINVSKSILTVNVTGDSLMCSSSLSSIQANCNDPNAILIWNGSTNGSTYSPNATGWVKLLASNGICVVSDSIFVQVNDPPVVNLGHDTTLCNTDKLLLSMDTLQHSFSWEDGSSTLLRDVSLPGTYSILATNGACTFTDTMLVANWLLSTQIIGDTSICFGDSTLLTAVNTGPIGAQGFWQGQPTGAINYLSSINETVVYSLKMDHCEVQDSITVVINPLPNFTLGPDTLLCNGNSLALTVPVGNYQILWEDGSSSNIRSLVTPGLYSAVLTSPDSCSLADSIAITVNTPFDIISADSVMICRDSSYVIDLSGKGQSFNWVELGTASSSASINNSGWYNVQLIDNWSCQQSDSVYVAVDTIVLDLGNDTVLCAPYQFTINVAPLGSGFIWNEGTIGGSFQAQQSGLYSVIGVNFNNCPVADQIRIDFDTLNVDLGGDTSICDYESYPVVSQVTANQSQNVSYSWFDGSTDDRLVLSQGGVVWLAVNDGYCQSVDSIILTVNASPVVNIGNDTLICAYDSISLGSICQNTCRYLWNTGALTAQISASSPDNYWVEVTNSFNCKNSDTLALQVEQAPDFSFSDSLKFCKDSLFVLAPSVTDGYRYLWNTGDTSLNVQVTEEGTYVLTAYSKHDCRMSDSTFVQVIANSIVDLGPDQIICDSSLIRVGQSKLNGESFLWSNGISADSITVEHPGVYRLSVRNELNCLAFDEVTFTGESTPQPFNEEVIVTCDFNSVVLQSDGDESIVYRWDSGSEFEYEEVTDTGLFMVEKSNFCGTAIDQFSVKYKENCDCRAYVPSGLTPDNDGLNDEFSIASECELSDYDLAIYNRWGKIVFQSSNREEKWMPQNWPIDVYVYTLKYSTWQVNKWKETVKVGTISIVR